MTHLDRGPGVFWATQWRSKAALGDMIAPKCAQKCPPRAQVRPKTAIWSSIGTPNPRKVGFRLRGASIFPGPTDLRKVTQKHPQCIPKGRPGTLKEPQGCPREPKDSHCGACFRTTSAILADLALDGSAKATNGARAPKSDPQNYPNWSDKVPQDGKCLHRKNRLSDSWQKHYSTDTKHIA